MNITSRVHSFVEACLRPREERPAAADLLSHNFIAEQIRRLEQSLAEAKPVPKVCRPAGDASSLHLQQVVLAGGKLKGVKGTQLAVCLTLNIKGKQKEIAFPFDTQKDTAEGIASEMVITFDAS